MLKSPKTDGQSTNSILPSIKIQSFNGRQQNKQMGMLKFTEKLSPRLQIWSFNSIKALTNQNLEKKNEAFYMNTFQSIHPLFPLSS